MLRPAPLAGTGGALLPPPLGGAPTSSAQAESAKGAGLGLLSPPAGWGDRGSVPPPPPPLCAVTSPLGPPE